MEVTIHLPHLFLYTANMHLQIMPYTLINQ